MTRTIFRHGDTSAIDPGNGLTKAILFTPRKQVPLFFPSLLLIGNPADYDFIYEFNGKTTYVALVNPSKKPLGTIEIGSDLDHKIKYTPCLIAACLYKTFECWSDHNPDIKINVSNLNNGERIKLLKQYNDLTQANDPTQANDLTQANTVHKITTKNGVSKTFTIILSSEVEGASLGNALAKELTSQDGTGIMLDLGSGTTIPTTISHAYGRSDVIPENFGVSVLIEAVQKLAVTNNINGGAKFTKAEAVAILCNKPEFAAHCKKLEKPLQKIICDWTRMLIDYTGLAKTIASVKDEMSNKNRCMDNVCDCQTKIPVLLYGGGACLGSVVKYMRQNLFNSEVFDVRVANEPSTAAVRAMTGTEFFKEFGFWNEATKVEYVEPPAKKQKQATEKQGFQAEIK